MFAIIETYCDEIREVATMPKSWIYNNPTDGVIRVYWPLVTKDLTKMIKNEVPPGKSWVMYECTILKENISSYREARAIEKSQSIYSNS
jgi:hypothetical protein